MHAVLEARQEIEGIVQPIVGRDVRQFICSGERSISQPVSKWADDASRSSPRLVLISPGAVTPIIAWTPAPTGTPMSSGTVSGVQISVPNGTPRVASTPRFGIRYIDEGRSFNSGSPRGALLALIYWRHPSCREKTFVLLPVSSSERSSGEGSLAVEVARDVITHLRRSFPWIRLSATFCSVSGRGFACFEGLAVMYPPTRFLRWSLRGWVASLEPPLRRNYNGF